MKRREIVRWDGTPAPIHIRVVIERLDGALFRLRVNDLSGLRDCLGAEVLERFCACFIHADRLTSLIGFMFHSIDRSPDGSVALRRDFLTFYSFACGTLKELGLNLQGLNDALKKRGLFDEESWERGLKKWVHWSNDAASSHVRNTLAFHVDEGTLGVGVERVCAEAAGDFDVFSGEGVKVRDSWAWLAQCAFLRAIEIKESDLAKVIGAPRDFLMVDPELETEFTRVLNLLGLKPIVCVRRGLRVEP